MKSSSIAFGLCALSSACLAIPSDQVVPTKLWVLGDSSKCLSAFTQGEHNPIASLGVRPCQNPNASTFFGIAGRANRPASIYTHPGDKGAPCSQLNNNGSNLDLSTPGTKVYLSAGSQLPENQQSQIQWSIIEVSQNEAGQPLYALRVCDRSILNIGPNAGCGTQGWYICGSRLDCGGLCLVCSAETCSW